MKGRLKQRGKQTLVSGLKQEFVLISPGACPVPDCYCQGQIFKEWRLKSSRYTNREMLRIARLIARWNGYELVKKKEKK